MRTSENKFNIAFHNREAWKYNIYSIISKIALIVFPFIFFLFSELWMILVIIFFELFFYVLSVKMKTLRDINIFASEEFKKINERELKEIFRQ